MFEVLGQSVREFAAGFISSNATILRALGVPIPASTFGEIGSGSVKAGVNDAGGTAGFKPNEVPAILGQGEEVLTEGDPRRHPNAGAGGDREQPINLKNVDVLDMGAAADGILAT